MGSNTVQRRIVADSIEDVKLQSPLLHVRALEALANPDCGWFYWADADGSRAIPGSRGR